MFAWVGFLGGFWLDLKLFHRWALMWCSYHSRNPKCSLSCANGQPRMPCFYMSFVICSHVNHFGCFLQWILPGVSCLTNESPTVLLQFFVVEPSLACSSFSIIRILQLIGNDLPNPNRTPTRWCRNPWVMSLYQKKLTFSFCPSFLWIHLLPIHFQMFFLISNVWWGLWRDFSIIIWLWGTCSTHRLVVTFKEP